MKGIGVLKRPDWHVLYLNRFLRVRIILLNPSQINDLETASYDRMEQGKHSPLYFKLLTGGATIQPRRHKPRYLPPPPDFNFHISLSLASSRLLPHTTYTQRCPPD